MVLVLRFFSTALLMVAKLVIATGYSEKSVLLAQLVFPAETEKMREPAPEISSQKLRFASNATYRELCGPIRAIWCDLQF